MSDIEAVAPARATIVPPPFSSERAAAPAAPPEPSPGVAQTPATIVSFSPQARLDEGRAAAAALERHDMNSAGDALHDAVEDALGSIRWLLEALGMDKGAAETARGSLRDEARRALPQRSDSASDSEATIEIRHEQKISVEFHDVEISVQDGDSTVRTSIRSVSINIQSETTISVQRPAERRIDPLVLDLSGDGIRLTPPAQGQAFDLDGDGGVEQTAWVQGDDALLAMDRDGDGRISSGRELFGEANGGKDGFEELARLDSNGDQVIDTQDPGFASLLLLREGGRLDSLADSGIARIRLDVVTPVQVPADGGLLVAQSLFERSDGGKGLIADALFDVRV